MPQAKTLLQAGERDRDSWVRLLLSAGDAHSPSGIDLPPKPVKVSGGRGSSTGSQSRSRGSSQPRAGGSSTFQDPSLPTSLCLTEN